MTISDTLNNPITYDYQILLSDKSFIDAEYLFDSFDNDKEFLIELLSLLFNDLANRFSNLKLALLNENYDEAKFIIHKLTGTSGVYGMVKAHLYLNECENNISKDTLKAIPYLTELFENYRLFFSDLLSHNF